VRGIPHVNRVFGLTGNADEVEIGEAQPLREPVLRIAEEALVP
jgi:hypothetical protein